VRRARANQGQDDQPSGIGGPLVCSLQLFLISVVLCTHQNLYGICCCSVSDLFLDTHDKSLIHQDVQYWYRLRFPDLAGFETHISDCLVTIFNFLSPLSIGSKLFV
jgi:hypothetical protein